MLENTIPSGSPSDPGLPDVVSGCNKMVPPPSHISAPVMDFLRSKFGDNIVSKKPTKLCSPYSPDLSPLGFSYWSLAMSLSDALMRAQGL